MIHLDEAVGHLRELGSLSVRNLAFCKNVFGYGAYEPINSPVFSPGQQLTLYLEVENYHSESTAKGYSTKLGANYEIVTDAGERVAGGDFPNIEDTLPKSPPRLPCAIRPRAAEDGQERQAPSQDRDRRSTERQTRQRVDRV